MAQSGEQSSRKGDYRSDPPTPQMHPDATDGYYYTGADGQLAESVQTPDDFDARPQSGMSPEAAHAITLILSVIGLLLLGALIGWLVAVQTRMARREAIYTEIRRKAVEAKKASDHRRIDRLFDLFDTVRKQFGADKNGDGGLMTLGAAWGDLDGRFRKLLTDKQKGVLAEDVKSPFTRKFTSTTTIEKEVPAGKPPKDEAPEEKDSVAAQAAKLADEAYAFWVEEEVAEGKVKKTVDKRADRLAEIRDVQLAVLGFAPLPREPKSR